MNTKPKTTLKEELFLSDEFASREALEAAVEFWDATTASMVAACPRRGEYFAHQRIVPLEEPLFLAAGNALHAGLDTLYTFDDPDLALEELRVSWGEDRTLPPNHPFAHLHIGFLEVVFKNYMDYRKRHDAFQPLVFELDQLDLSDVVAAVWRVAPNGKIVLGESKVVMRFEVEGANGEPTEFLYAGKPDLPIYMGGAHYVFDHKTTNSYLSDWYFSQYKHSNQLRGYCKIEGKLIQQRVTGAVINGLYMGPKAADPGFRGSRFSRYGPLEYRPAQLDEAIRNQAHWFMALQHYAAAGYFPQHTSKLCSHCPYDELCSTPPRLRPVVLQQAYRKSNRAFLDL